MQRFDCRPRGDGVEFDGVDADEVLGLDDENDEVGWWLMQVADVVYDVVRWTWDSPIEGGCGSLLVEERLWLAGMKQWLKRVV